MATTLPVVVDVTAKNDGKAQAAFGQINAAADKFTTGVDRMVAGLDRVLARLSKMESSGAKAGKATATGLELAAAAAQRTAQATARAEQTAANAVLKAARERAKASKEAEDAASRLRVKVEQSGQAAAIGFGTAAAVLGGLAGAVLTTANKFEVLLTRLQTVQGSGAVAIQTFREAQDYAAKTPFDVEGIVDATVTLEVYGQRSKEVLPRVAALAAGMGKDIKGTALVVGKALSGSQEGFESLRNEYGITTRELVRFGAQTDKAGGLLLRTGEQARAAGDALKTIVDARFGDAIERQSQTLTGQLSNIGDQITGLAADVGTGAAAVVKAAVAPAAFLLGLVREIPGPLKAVAGGALVLAAGVATVAAGGTAAAAGLLLLNTQLVAAAEVIPVLGTAAAASTAAVSGLGGAFTFLTATALPALLASPVAIVLLAAAAAAGVGTLALNAYNSALEGVGAEMAAESALFQARAQQYRDITQAVRELNSEEAKRKGIQPDPAAAGRAEADTPLKKLEAARARIAEAKKTLDTASTSDFFSKFKAIGLDAEQAKVEAGKIGAEIQAQYAKLGDLKRQLEDRKDFVTGNGLGSFDPNKDEGVQALQAQVAALDGQLSQNEELRDLLGQVNDKYGVTAVSLERLNKLGQASDDFQKYAKAAGDLSSLNEGAAVASQTLSKMGDELRKLNEPTDRQSILSKLQDPDLDAKTRAAFNSYLDQLSNVEAADKEVGQKRDEGTKKQIETLRESLNERKALGKVSSADELANLEQQLTQANALVEGKENEKSRILREMAAVRASDRKKEGDAIKAELSDSLKGASVLPVSARSKGSGDDNKGTRESVAAYDQAIAKVLAWQATLEMARAKQAKLGDQARVSAEEFVKLGQQGKASLEQLQIARAADEAARLAKNLSTIKSGFQDAFEDAEVQGPASQLAVVEKTIADIKQRQLGHDLDNKAAGEELRDLGRQKLSIEQAITQEKLRQAGDLSQLAISGIEQEIQLLEIRKEQGLKVDQELLAKTAELHQAKLDDLKVKLDQELAAAGENADAKAAIHQKYNLLERQLDNERTLQVEGNYAKQRQAKEKASTPSKSRSDQGGSSAGQSSSPGTPSNTPFSSGIEFSGFGTGGQNSGRRERREEKEAARRLSFEAANADVLTKLRRADADKAAAVAAQQTKNSQVLRGFGDPARASAAAGQSDQVRAAGSAPAAPEATQTARSSSEKKGTVVNNNQTATFNFNGRSVKTQSVKSNEDAVRKVKRHLDEQAMFGGPSADAMGFV